MSATAYLKTDCELCGGHIEYPSELAGLSIECPHCQQTTALPAPFPQKASAASFKTVQPETLVWEGSPSHWKYAAYWVLGVLLIALYGTGLLVLLLIWIDRRSHKYRVTTKRVTTELGIFSKSSFETRIRDIRVINLVRSGLGGLFGVGTLQFGSAGTAGIEVAFEAIADPKRVKEIVNSYREDG